MAKYISPAVLDAALAMIATADKQIVCSDQPTTFAEANSLMLAEVAMTATDFTIGNGTGPGRKVTVAAKTGSSVQTSGTGNHIALVNTATSSLLLVTTMTPQPLTEGNPLTFASFSDELKEPV